MTLKALIVKFLAWLKLQVEQGTNRPRTLEYYTNHLQLAQVFIGKKTEVSTIIPFTLAMWATTWHRWQTTKRLFKWAVDMGLLKTSPAAELPEPPRGQRKRIFSPHEGARFLRRARRDFREFLLGMRESMARPQEVREFEWAWLKRSPKGHLYFALDEFKARRRRKDKDAVRIIPVTPRLARLLARIAARHGQEGLIFKTKRGRPWSKETIRGRIRRLRSRLGIQPDKRGETVVAYTWRHTSATAACAGGLRDRMLSELMGHTSTKTTARYQHLQTDELLDAFHQIRGNALAAADVSDDLLQQLRALLAQLEKNI